jgi:hypothetical protein
LRWYNYERTSHNYLVHANKKEVKSPLSAERSL